MDPAKPYLLLSALAVFRNLLNEELIRTVHVNRSEDGDDEITEREFMFSPTSYVEMVADPLRKLSRFRVSELVEGRIIDLWICILAFHADRPIISSPVPSILVISRNPKLKSIPTLANDLQKVLQLRCRTGGEVLEKTAPREMCGDNRDNSCQTTRIPISHQDHFSLPHSMGGHGLSETQQIDEGVPEVLVMKKKRAATDHVASIALTDLAKYFDLPITEASRNLKVGLTVLKRKCREFGIPRWPHRKIKSLDTLIHDLQEEAERQERENQVAAKAVAKRQRMLESEKEGIERKPFMEIKSETKRFRQDVFKRRHRARAALNNRSRSPSLERHEA